MSTNSEKKLEEKIAIAVEEYIEESIDTFNDDSYLYRMILDCVEKPLLSILMRKLNGNQSRIATIFCMNLATLRSKLRRHDFI